MSAIGGPRAARWALLATALLLAAACGDDTTSTPDAASTDAVGEGSCASACESRYVCADGYVTACRAPEACEDPCVCDLPVLECLAGCAEVARESGPPEALCEPAGTTHLGMDFTRSGGFYTAPFPSQDLLDDAGRPNLADFPNPRGNPLVRRLTELLEADASGFGTSAGIFFRATAPLDADALPQLHDSIAPPSPIFLISVERDSPDFGRRYPITTAFEADGGPFGSDNLLSLLPIQGVPLSPGTSYAAVVRRDLADAEGRSLQAAPELTELLSGGAPDGLSGTALADYRAAIEALRDLGVNLEEVAALAVFRTDRPTAQLGDFREAVLDEPLPTPTEPFQLTDVFEDYCVLESRLEMPVYQQGDPPFLQEGGAWATDADGAPLLQTHETARLVVTLPRQPMPDAGFPLVVFIRTGGGGDRPLVDRGARGVAGGPSLVPGSGAALEFARVGFAGLSVDGPHGGLRNVSNGDEQFLMFNVSNPAATRDNIRQSALELILLAHVAEALEIDLAAVEPVAADPGESVADACAGLTSNGDAPLGFDTERLALMGHSMGATIAPLVLAFEPSYRAAILSGAGGSWIENIVFKESPIEVRPIAELVLGYTAIGRSLGRHDPVLSLFQWGGEPADPPVYAWRIVRPPRAELGPPRHVLMLQGIVDTYILPPMANATSLSLGLDLAGPALDADEPRLDRFTPLADVLDLVGAEQLALPVEGNVEWAVDGASAQATAVVVQHTEDGVEDGHEVVFQTEAPKRQYRCFLESLAQNGLPRVPSAEDPAGLCE